VDWLLLGQRIWLFFGWNQEGGQCSCCPVRLWVGQWTDSARSADRSFVSRSALPRWANLSSSTLRQPDTS